MKTRIILLTIIATAFFLSCKKSFEKPGWDSRIVAPMVSSSLSIENIIRDTNFVKLNPDNSITLVNRDSLASISLDTLVVLNTPTFEQTRRVEEITLDTRSDTTRITLGELCRRAVPPIPIGFFHGSNSPIPVNTPVINIANLPIDVSSFFEEAWLKTGNMNLRIVNGLPLDMNNVSFDINNAVNNDVIISRAGLEVDANTTYNDDEVLDGKYVEGTLKASISLQGTAAAGFYVDTNDAVEIIMTISNVKIDSATAIFPEQTIVDNLDVVILEGMGDAQLVEAVIQSGEVVAEAISTIQDSMFFDYEIPGATLNGVPFTTTEALPPADPGDVSNQFYSYDFAGYRMDFTGKIGDTVNTFANRLVGKIHESGRLIRLTLKDSIRMRIATRNLKPSYVRGYLGRDTIQIGPSTISLDLFKNIISGTLDFEEADLRLSIENEMGIPGGVIINSVTATNTRNGQSVSLVGAGVGSNYTFPIAPATDNPLTMVPTEINLSTSAGYNPEDLLSILPDRITYDVMVITNPNGFNNDYNQFAYTDKTITANLDLSIPLSIISNSLTLSDTVALNPEGIKNRNVTQGKINVVTDNGFPIEATLEMYLMDGNYNITDTLRSDSKALAAQVDGTYRVTGKQRSIISFEADESVMTRLYDSKFVAFKASFTTNPNDTHLKIYSDYSIDFRIVGDVNYRF